MKEIQFKTNKIKKDNCCSFLFISFILYLCVINIIAPLNITHIMLLIVFEPTLYMHIKLNEQMF